MSHKLLLSGYLFTALGKVAFADIKPLIHRTGKYQMPVPLPDSQTMWDGKSRRKASEADSATCVHGESPGCGSLFMRVSAGSVPSKRLRKALIKMCLQQRGKSVSGEESGCAHLPSDELDANCSFRCGSPPSDTVSVAF